MTLRAPAQEFGMPMVPEQATASARPSRHAARRASARVALMGDSDDDSAWEPVQAAHRRPNAWLRVPKEETMPVTESVLRNRITQRHYLQRKKVCCLLLGHHSSILHHLHLTTSQRRRLTGNLYCALDSVEPPVLKSMVRSSCC